MERDVGLGERSRQPISRLIDVGGAAAALLSRVHGDIATDEENRLLASRGTGQRLRQRGEYLDHAATEVALSGTLVRRPLHAVQWPARLRGAAGSDRVGQAWRVRRFDHRAEGRYVRRRMEPRAIVGEALRVLPERESRVDDRTQVVRPEPVDGGVG